MEDKQPAGVGPVEQGLGPAPERAALPNRWRVVCTPGAEPYFERHAEGAWAQRERVDAEIAAAVAAEQKRWANGIAGMAKAAADNNDLRVYELLRGLADALFRA